MENVELNGQEPKGTDWLNLILNILIIILGIILIILVWHYGLGDCDKLKFDLEGKNLNAGEFMKLYSDRCLDKTNIFKQPNFSNLQYSQPYP